MRKNKEIEEELEQISSYISKINKPTVPQVPEMYFEGFSDRLFRRIKNENSQPRITRISWSSNIILKRILSSPIMQISMIVFFLLVGIRFFNPTTRSTEQFLEIDIASDDAFAYIYDNIDQFEVQKLAEKQLEEETSNKLLEEILKHSENIEEIDENIESLNLEDFI